MRIAWTVSAAVFGVTGTALTAAVLGRGGGLSVVHVILTPLVGWSFGVIGLLACLRERWRRVGGLMVVVGVAWFVHLLDWTHVPALVSAAAPVRNAYLAVFAHVLLAFPVGRLGSRSLRALVGAGYLDAVGVQSLATVCGGIWYDVEAVGGILLAGLVMVVLIRREPGTGRSGSRPPGAVWCAAVLACAALVANLLSSWFTPRLELALWIAFSAAFAAVPLGFLAYLLGVRLRRGGVAALVVRLGRVVDPVGLRVALADALRDQSLELAFWVPDQGRFVDGRGHAVQLPAEEDRRMATFVERDRRRVAALIHDRALESEPELVDAVAAAAGLALDNARLQAELRAHLVELKASRARLVEATAAERRRIERNLHDGAQQRLVSVAFALGLVESRLPGDPAAAQAALIDARAGLAGALEDLRRLSQGIHPGVLVERGLCAGVTELAWASPVPVVVEWEAPERLPDAVELAGYYVVAEGLVNAAKHARAKTVRVRVVHHDRRVVLVIADDGVGGADITQGSGLQGLADRVEALGGELAMSSPPARGTTIRVELPCG